MNPLDFISASARLLGGVAAKLERLFDAAVGGLAAAILLLGSLVRLAQTGRVQQYLVFALIGLVVAVAWLVSG